MRSDASAALLILLSLATGRVAESDSQPATYRTLVESYREQRRADTDAVLAMPHDAVSAAVDRALSDAGRWPWEQLRAAAMLHAETCIAAPHNAGACEFHIIQAERLLERTMALSPDKKMSSGVGTA